MAIDASLVGARATAVGTTITTTAGATSTGDTLVAVVSYDPGKTISSIADTAGNTYTLAAEVVNSEKLALYYCQNAAGNASNVLTVTMSGTDSFGVAHLIKITGAATASYDSGSLTANNSDTTSPFTITSGTLAQADSVVIAACAANRDAPAGSYASSNFTVLSEEPDVPSWWTSCVSKLVVASTSAVTPSHTRVNSTSTAARSQIVVAFKALIGAANAGIGARVSSLSAQPMIRGPN